MRPPLAENIERMAGYVPGEQPKGVGIVKLNTNENPYPPSPKVAEALARFDAASLRRYPDPTAAPLRERLAEIHGTRPERVFAGNGSDEILALATRCFVRRGGRVGAFTPTYSLYPVLAEIRDVGYVEASLAGDFGWRAPEFPGGAPDLFFLTCPNAPTGVAYPRDAVAAFAKGFTGTVLIDEAYADFADSNCMDLATAPDNENVVVSRTMSKSFSLAGLRFGYCVGPEPLIEAMFKAKDSYNLDAVTQALALAALDDLAWMRDNAEKVKAERERLSAAIAGLGWSCTRSQANFVFARPPDGNAQAVFAALKARNIFVRHFALPGISGHLRITVGTPAENDRLLGAIGDCSILPEGDTKSLVVT